MFLHGAWPWNLRDRSDSKIGVQPDRAEGSAQIADSPKKKYAHPTRGQRVYSGG